MAKTMEKIAILAGSVQQITILRLLSHGLVTNNILILGML